MLTGRIKGFYFHFCKNGVIIVVVWFCRCGDKTSISVAGGGGYNTAVRGPLGRRQTDPCMIQVGIYWRHFVRFYIGIFYDPRSYVPDRCDCRGGLRALWHKGKWRLDLFFQCYRYETIIRYNDRFSRMGVRQFSGQKLYPPARTRQTAIIAGNGFFKPVIVNSCAGHMHHTLCCGHRTKDRANLRLVFVVFP